MKAEADLDGILAYISQDDPAAAARLVERLTDACVSLGPNPELGERRPEYPPGRYRCLSVLNYAIVYEITAETVAIIRVLHGARDIGPIFGENS